MRPDLTFGQQSVEEVVDLRPHDRFPPEWKGQGE